MTHFEVPLADSFRFVIELPKKVSVSGRVLSRDDFFEFLWAKYGSVGLVGIHEGTVLAEQAAPQGKETESWTLDSAEAPRERDWIGDQNQLRVEIYCESEVAAQKIHGELLAENVFPVLAIEKVEDQDWDAEWKASFQGSEVEPFWRILPPWVDEAASPGRAADGKVLIRLNPGAGFGTGTHETTQLCLEVFGRWSKLQTQGKLKGLRVLDFGSGSGILSFGAALLGAQVLSIEIDPLAIENGVENAVRNGISDQIVFADLLPPQPDRSDRFDLIFANILKPVLLRFRDELLSRLKPGGILILSGLVENDVAEVSKAYASAGPLQVFQKNEWRAISTRF
ncbi:MAG: 50S ribosomal protein L11 methyltransferase [Bdellovibrionales bacterium]|nr:50S ribosomal protein L11 methyltransferase [Bdellovibrionales bacterium]